MKNLLTRTTCTGLPAWATAQPFAYSSIPLPPPGFPPNLANMPPPPPLPAAPMSHLPYSSVPPPPPLPTNFSGPQFSGLNNFSGPRGNFSGGPPSGHPFHGPPNLPPAASPSDQLRLMSLGRGVGGMTF